MAMAAASATGWNEDLDWSKLVKIKTSDGDIYHVTLHIIRQSNTILTMLESLGFHTAETDNWEPIPVEQVSSTTMAKVIEWCEHHKFDPPPVEEEEDPGPQRSDDIPIWDQQFLDIDQTSLFDLILAANYLDIKGLVDMTCKTVADLINGKSVEELRQTFNIENDFTPEEEEQIRRENAWCDG